MKSSSVFMEVINILQSSQMAPSDPHLLGGTHTLVSFPHLECKLNLATCL